MSFDSFNPAESAMQEAFSPLERVENNESQNTPEQRRNVQRERIAFELRRIANELNNGQGITSLRDTEQITRFTDGIDISLVARIAPIFDDRLVTADEINDLVGNSTERMLTQTLQELRSIGNQLQLSQEADLRDLEVFNEVNAILDESQFRSIEDRFSFMDNSVQDIEKNISDMDEIASANSDRYFSLDGIENFLTDQEALNRSERSYYEANEIVISTYNNSIINSYNEVSETLTEYNEIIDRLSLVGSRHIMGMLEEYRANLVTKRDLAARNIQRLNDHPINRSTSRLRTSILNARTNVSRILSDGINTRIDESNALASREQSEAELQGEELISQTEERNNLIRERLTEERELLIARQQEIIEARAAIEEEATSANSVIELAANEANYTERRVINSIATFCRLTNVGANQLSEFINSHPSITRVLSPEQRQNLLIAVTSVVPDSNSRGSITIRSAQGLRGSIEMSGNNRTARNTDHLLSLLGTLGEVNTQRQNPVFNFSTEEISERLNQEESSISSRLNNIDLVFQSLDDSLNNVRTGVAEHMSAIESQIAVLNLTMQEGMQKLYEVQGNNDLAREGFTANSVSVEQTRENALSENMSLGNQLTQLRIPEVPSVFVRGFRMVTLPIEAVGNVADRGLGAGLYAFRAGSTALFHGGAVLTGNATLSWSEAMQDHRLADMFSYKGSEILLDSGETLTDLRMQLLENGTATGHLMQFPLAFIANTANAAGAVIETLKRLDYISTAIATIASSENPGESLLNIGSSILHLEDLTERGDVFGWGGNVASEAVIFLSTAGTASIVRGTATSLTRQAVRVSPTLQRVSARMAAVNVSRSNFQGITRAIQVMSYVSRSASPAINVSTKVYRHGVKRAAGYSAQSSVVDQYARRNNVIQQLLTPFYLAPHRIAVVQEFANESNSDSELETEIGRIDTIVINEAIALHWRPDFYINQNTLRT